MLGRSAIVVAGSCPAPPEDRAMTSATALLPGPLATTVIVGALLTAPAEAGDITFLEDFALAKDRAVSLRELIPGTEDYYYCDCVHFLTTEQLVHAEPLTRPWRERFGQTSRLTEIQTRFALLTYEKNPQRSLAYLRD